MVSLVIYTVRSRLWRTYCTVEHGVDLLQEVSAIRPGPTRTGRMQAGLTLKPSEGRSIWVTAGGRRRPGLEDGAGGGPAEERAWARGRGMRLRKIGGSDHGLGCENGMTTFFRIGP